MQLYHRDVEAFYALGHAVYPIVVHELEEIKSLIARGWHPDPKIAGTGGTSVEQAIADGHLLEVLINVEQKIEGALCPPAPLVPSVSVPPPDPRPTPVPFTEEQAAINPPILAPVNDSRLSAAPLTLHPNAIAITTDDEELERLTRPDAVAPATITGDTKEPA